MKQLINQFDTRDAMIEQFSKDLILLTKNHVVVNFHTFYDIHSEKETSVIFYYE